MPNISVIIPVYKAEDCLHELYRRLKATLETITTDFEVLLIEDCGGDRSWDIIVKLSKLDSRIKGIQFSRNFGQHYGITAGLDYCNGDWIVIMDCDLQDRPEEIPKLYIKAQEGYEVVLARRGKRKDNLFKRLTSRIYNKIFCYLTDIQYDHQVANFRIISRKVAENCRLMREQLRFFGGLVEWLGFAATSVPIEHGERFQGKSSYTLRKLCKLASDAILAYSDKPLRLVVRFGFMLSLLAFIYGIYILIRSLIFGSLITGWSSLIISIYFIGGIIIAILGIIGVYLGKTFDETKKRPLYIISKRT